MASISVQLVEVAGAALDDVDNVVAIASKLISTSQNTCESREGVSRCSESGGINYNNDTPLTALHDPSIHIDDGVQHGEIPLTSHSLISGNAPEQPTIRLAAVTVVTDNTETHVESRPQNAANALIFSQVSIPEPASASSDGSDHWRPVMAMDFEFAEALKADRAKANPGASHAYNLRSRQHMSSSVKATASEELSVGYAPDPSTLANRPRGSSRAKGSKSASHTQIPMSTRLADILPRDTRERMTKDSTRCVALTKKSQRPRCKNRIKGALEGLKTLPSALTSFEVKPGNEPPLKLVKSLIQFALCGNCHKKSAAAEFDEICELSANMSEHDRSEFEEWIKALALEPQLAEEEPPKPYAETAGSADSDSTATSDRETPESPVVGRPVTRSQTARTQPRKPATASSAKPAAPVPRQMYAQDFKPYLPKCEEGISTSALIRKRLTKPLTETELKPGYIYMYWFPGNFGYLKIGYTTVNSTQRLKLWQRQCRHPSTGVEDLFAVPHVARVEKLIHAELKDLRRWEKKCRGCGKNHKEWFYVQTPHAKNVFMKWAEWIMTEPYSEETGWNLNEAVDQDKIEDLCQPLQMETGRRPLVRPKRKSNPRR